MPGENLFLQVFISGRWIILKAFNRENYSSFTDEICFKEHKLIGHI